MAMRPVAGRASDDVRRLADRGPRGPRAGPQAAGHVHRLDRPERPPPPGLGGRRQLRRRGHGRLLHPHRRDAAAPTAACRVVDDGRGIPVDPHPKYKGKSGAEVVLTDPARRRQVRRRRLQGLRRPARRRRVGGQRPVAPPRGRDRPRRQAPLMEFADGGKLKTKLHVDGPGAAGPHRHHRHVLARRRRSSRRSSSEPDHPRAVPDDGVPQQGPRDPLPRRAPGPQPTAETFKYKGGIVDFVRHLNASKEPLFKKVGYFEESEEGLRRSRSPSSGTPATTTACTPSPTASPPSRAACTRRASRRPSPTWSTSTPGPRTCSRRRTTTSGRGHPRGPHRHHLGAAHRSPVRGPDQGQARQRLHALAGRAGHQREAGRLARGEPDRGQGGRHEGDRRPPAPAMAAKSARDATRRKTALEGAGHARQAQGLPDEERRRGRAVHRRGRLRRRLGHPGPQPRSTRRSCPSAARSSTSSGPASTRC